ncbi:MAG: DUF4390 domain-containing protein [Pseudomonadota bacterium]
MTVFSTPCCARPDAWLRRFAVACLAGLLVFAGAASANDRSAIRQAAVLAVPQGYAVDAEIDVVLNRTLEDALAKGINLYFLLDFEITRPRDWWFDEDIVETTRRMRLYYHLLLRRYVVESGYTTRTAATLPEALAQLGRVEGWQVLERGALKTGQRYNARLRLRLDTSQLPKPLSIGAVSGDRWELATPWHAWSFDAPAFAPAVPPVAPSQP